MYDMGVLPPSTTFDRFQLVEDTNYGQRVLNFTLSILPIDAHSADDAGGQQEEQVLRVAHAIGIKRIVVLDQNITTKTSTAVKLTVTHAVAPPILKQVAVFEPCYGPRPPPPVPPPSPPGSISPLTCKTIDNGSGNATLPCKAVLRGKLCVNNGSLIGVGTSEHSLDACYKWCVASKGCAHFSYNSLVENGGHWCIRFNSHCTARPTSDPTYTTYKLCSVPWGQC